MSVVSQNARFAVVFAQCCHHPPPHRSLHGPRAHSRTHVDSLNAFTVTVSGVASRARLHSFELSTDGVLLPSLPSLPPCNYEGQTAYIHLHCGRPRHAMVDGQGARVKVTNRPPHSTIMQAQIMFVRHLKWIMES